MRYRVLFGLVLSGLIAIVLYGVIGMLPAQAEKHGDISALRKIYKGAGNFAEAGDLIELGIRTDPFDGPFDLKIEIRGDGVTFQVKPVIVFAAGPRPDPAKSKEDLPPDEVRAYFTVEGKGDVTFVVTPISPSDRPKKDPVEFPIKISEKGTLQMKPG